MNNEEQLSDEERNYNKWVSENLFYINQHKQSLSVMKKIYLDGFAAGWQFKKEYTAKEWLEK